MPSAMTAGADCYHTFIGVFPWQSKYAQSFNVVILPMVNLKFFFSATKLAGVIVSSKDYFALGFPLIAK